MANLLAKNGKIIGGVPQYNNPLYTYTFSLTASNWTANSDSATSTDYPYIYSISTNYYTDNSVPIWDLNGVGTIPTSVERDSINMILEAVFSSTGIILYATDLPTEDLVLRVKGA